MKKLFLAAFCGLAAPALFPANGTLVRAQTASASFYTQSFRQGPTHVTEQSLEAKLDPQNPVFRQRIKDAHGNERYVLTLAPQGPEGDNKITSWKVKLVDLHHVIYDNILLASQEPSSDAANNLWRLEPRNFEGVPIGAQRIIKVDSFYVTIEVKAYHFTPVDSPYLDSMTVQVKFSNTDPRSPSS